MMMSLIGRHEVLHGVLDNLIVYQRQHFLGHGGGLRQKRVPNPAAVTAG